MGEARQRSGAGEFLDLSNLVLEILKSFDSGATPTSLKAAEKEFESIARRDYRRQILSHFSRREMRQVFDALAACLPALNNQVSRITELPRLTRIAADLGARLHACRFSGADGHELRGFYVAESPLGTPLICVNTAHHPVAIASAFWHEVGHHLTAQKFGEYPQPVAFSLSSDYQEHLNDPLELIADMLVVLSAYPKVAARRVFAAARRSGAAPSAQDIVSKARTHLRSVAGFEFSKQFSAIENLHYLAGMLHYANLRWALLSEYDL
jgi:hypothetical protein